jgi:hypothetical protein
MTPNPSDTLAINVAPIIYYSPGRYRLVVAIGMLLTASWLAYGITQSQAIDIASGIAGLLLVGLFARGIKGKLRYTGIALAREGDLLVGGELDRPLPVSETTFEIVSDYRGSWVIVLRSRDATTRLGAGGWRIEGERFVTKKVAERVLLALGLKHRAH